MKTTYQILILMAIMSLMACGSQLHVVTLYVDTAQIDQNTIDANAHFGQRAGIANSDFTTHVRKRDRVIWLGVSTSNPSDSVNITSIVHVSGEKLFERKPLKRMVLKSGFGNNRIVVGTIKIGPGKQKQYIQEKYSLNFSVTNKGTFQIDPVIKGHPNH